MNIIIIFAAARIGFGELDRRVPEASTSETIALTKSGTNMNDIVLLVSALTYSEFAAQGRMFPPEFDTIPSDPAECKYTLPYQH